MKKPTIAIIGAGPSGLFAAEILSRKGFNVHVYEKKPSVARKFLMAGRGGLNITHSEDFEKFVTRYNDCASVIKPILEKFTPNDMRDWCHDLGQETFIGSSGRVFPTAMKASPLLRAWLARLEKHGVHIHTRHTWTGWDDHEHTTFQKDDGDVFKIKPDAVLLSLGGASWPSLGSDGTWAKILSEKNISIIPFSPSNCGFHIEWSSHIRNKFSGAPLKGIKLSSNNQSALGEIVITQNGIEGGAVYALSSVIRKTIEKSGMAKITIDLRPKMSEDNIALKLSKPRGKLTFSTWLQKTLHLSPLSIALLYEVDADLHKRDKFIIAATIKSIPFSTTSPFSLERAISSAGGLPFCELDGHLMITKLPGVFACGEMLDWEAPTGGYLLQASFATGKAAANGILHWINPSKMA